MATCIVCKAHFDPSSNTGARCLRCETDNRQWLKWQRRHPVEQGGWRGLLAFTQPHFYLPLLVSSLSTVLGLLFTYTLWLNIRSGFRAVALLVTLAGSLLSLQGMYEGRMGVREREMLRQVKRGWRRGLGAQATTLILPAVGAGIVLTLMYSVVKFEDLWDLVKWLALIAPPEVVDSVPEKVLAVLPFVSIVGYCVLTVSFTASSSLMLARRYINRLEFLPPPIFLQDYLLTRTVQHEAERVVRRPTTPRVIGGGKQRPRSWTWDEMERTENGGIRLRAIVKAGSKTEENLIGEQIELPVTYVVEADPWGRIVKVVRTKEEK